MTALATLYTREMILMAADSLELELDDYESRRVLGKRDAQKLFLLQRTGTGVSVSGYSSWGGKTVRDILRDFLEDLDFHHHSQEGVAERLCDFLDRFYPLLRTRFHFCGFDEGEPFVALVDYGDNGRRCMQRVNVDGEGRLTCGVLTFCEWETRKYARAHLRDLDVLSVDEGVDFMEKFFAHEMEVVARSKEIADVGGPVDLLLLKPGRQSFLVVKNIEDAILA